MSFWGSVWPIPVGCLLVIVFFWWLDLLKMKREYRAIEKFNEELREDGLFVDKVCSRNTNKEE